MRSHRYRRCLSATFTTLAALVLIPSGCGDKKAADTPKTATTDSKAKPAKADEPAKAKEDGTKAAKAEEAKGNEPTTKAQDKPATAPVATATPTVGKPGAALAGIPKSAYGVMIASNPGAMWTNHFLPALQKIPDFAEEKKKAAAASQMALGVDATTLEGLRSLGLDPAGEIGLFSLDPTKQLIGAFVPLSDPAKLKAMLQKVAEKSKMKVAFTKEGDTEWAMIRRNGLAMRGNVLYVVWQDGYRPDENAEATVAAALKTVATTKSDSSLLSREDFTKRMGAAGKGGNLKAWGDISGLVELVSAQAAKRKVAPVPERLTTRLAKAKADKNTAGIKSAEEAIAEHNKWEQRWQKRREAELKAIKSMFGTLTTMGWNFTADDKGVHGAMSVGMKADSPWGKLLKSFSGPAVTAQANHGPAVFTAHGALNKAALLEWAKLLAQAEGGTLDEVKAEFGKEFGINFDKELWAALGDQVGMVVNLDVAKVLAAPMVQRPKLFDASFVLKLADEAAIKALLNKAVPAALKEMMKVDEAAGRWSVDVPMFKTVHLTIKDGWLSVSTDAGYHARLTTPDAKTFKHPNAGVQAVLGAKDVAGVFALDNLTLAMAGMAEYAEPPARPLPSGATPEQVKQHAAYTAKYKELQTMQDARKKAQRERLSDAIGKVGTTAFTVSVAPQAMTARGGQFFNAKMSEVLSALIGLENQSYRTSPQERKLRDEVYTLENRLNRAPAAVAPKAPKGSKGK